MATDKRLQEVFLSNTHTNVRITIWMDTSDTYFIEKGARVRLQEQISIHLFN